MTKTKLIITGYKDSEDKSRCVFETADHGTLSAFNNIDQMTKEVDPLVGNLKANANKLIEVDVVKSKATTQGGKPYYNIRGFFGVAEEDTESPLTNAEHDECFAQKEHKGEFKKPSIKPQDFGTQWDKPKNGRKEYDKDPVGLAVEVFNALAENYKGTPERNGDDIMKQSIELVKQAQKAFS